MNNEPVAWMLVDESWNDFCRYSSYPSEGAIPLYTHPVKEQDTDCQYCKQGCIRCDARKQLTDEEILNAWNDEWIVLGKDEKFIKFARAILRKAQKK